MQEPFKKNPPLGFGYISFIKVDYTPQNFNDFTSLLKDYNINLMNKSKGVFSIEVAGVYKKYYAGLNWGYANNAVYNHDSLNIKLNTRQYSLHFGYNLINSKRFILTPKVTLKWNRYRLLNTDKEYKIPIEKYVSQRDMDIRFNQSTGLLGLNLSYKIYRFNILPTDYWTFGLYGAYLIKLHDKPLIYSRGNRLISSGKIDMTDYNLGIYFSFNFEWAR